MVLLGNLLVPWPFNSAFVIVSSIVAFDKAIFLNSDSEFSYAKAILIPSSLIFSRLTLYIYAVLVVDVALTLILLFDDSMLILIVLSSFW